ncbi:uncharacterized protein LOC107804598 isoform X2 [Nicotiana tabacum]|uniref:Uncharacterized protein LOC107804598 isoform X2 n=2 Tax=Nicotiana tabacum TaxID=4097 RepID=A0A1S4B4Z8_TOBAC|nr:PREDICTED: uncharacterized protein LOC107804598 isoform X2 [Nicotiana tabacum]
MGSISKSDNVFITTVYAMVAILDLNAIPRSQVMAPSKEWMQLVDNRLDKAYSIGVQKFLDYAFRRTGELYEVRCPCVKCCNTTSGTRETVESHLKVYGIIQNYTFWYHHGEILGEPQSDCELIAHCRRLLEKEHMQIDIPLPPSTDQGSCNTEKVKKVRGRNKCKEVASLEFGQKLKVTFYNNRTVGKNSNLFSRNLGKLVRDRNLCPLGVSSWHDIKEEQLNHMWAAVKDKFESDDMDIHRNHILGWMKELWNKWRGQLHAKYVKGKPVQEALKNMPKGIDKKQWEWLVTKHFSTESFQARSNRNASNRAKLKMPHHIGSKPIREIIYQKGGKDGKPPDLATIFFETRKKNNTLVDSETIEKHAQIQELVQSEPFLPSIEIVEKCFGPQIRSHVFGFGGGVKAKDLKRGTSSKAELRSELCSTREENQSLKDRLSTIENDVKELKQLKELLLAQHSNVQPLTLLISGE